MTASVRLSAKSARYVMDALGAIPGMPTAQLIKAVFELEQGLKPKKAKQLRRQRKEAKRQTKREVTAIIRANVFARAGDECELCNLATASDLHHALGRIREPQAEDNCLAICRCCHRLITDNNPSAVFWLGRQAHIFGLLGHHRTAAMLSARAEVLQMTGRTENR